MAFEDELVNNQFQLNVVVELAGQTYARYQPDSGITIPTENLILGNVNLQPLAVDIRDVKTTLPTNTFEILDINGLITTRMGASDNQLLNEPVIIKVGFITGSFDFADYKIFSSSLTTKMTRRPNAYRFSARENQDLSPDVFDSGNELIAALPEGEIDEMFLSDVSAFADGPAAFVKIDDEVIQYQIRNVADNKLEDLTRGDENSTEADHDSGAVVNRVDIVQGNPLELLLQIMISTPGNTTSNVYDTLPDGLAIDPLVIDVDGIEEIAIDNFGATGGGLTAISGGDQYRFVLVQTGQALTFFEQEILQATNTRFIQINGQTSIALLDQSVPGAAVGTIDESTIIGTPSWNLGTDKTINRIIVEWAWSEGLERYTRTSVFEDTDSQETFGFIKTLTLRFKGIQAALNGANIVQNRAGRLLLRLASAQTQITARTLFDSADFQIGDELNVIHRYLPDEGGTLGMSDQLEVISRGIDLNTGEVTFGLSYTSFFGLRIGVIAPSPPIDAVIDLSTFEVTDASDCYGEDFCIIINGEQRIIIDVTGDQITVDSDFSSLTVGDIVKFCDYDNQSAGQKGRFASICQDEGTGFPSDGSECFQIIP